MRFPQVMEVQTDGFSTDFELFCHFLTRLAVVRLNSR
jgi:hypothetical protein